MFYLNTFSNPVTLIGIINITVGTIQMIRSDLRQLYALSVKMWLAKLTISFKEQSITNKEILNIFF